MAEHKKMKTSGGEEDEVARALPSSSPSPEPPPSALPLDRFSPLPPATSQKQHSPPNPSYATSSSGQITPPASPTPPPSSVHNAPEPVTPRKAPPTPGSAPRTPIREDDPSPTYPRQRRESSALEQYFPERPSFSTSYSPPASPSRRVVSWPVPPIRQVTFDSANAPTWPLQAVPPRTRPSSDPRFRHSPSPSVASFPSSSTESTPPRADLSLPRIEISRTTSDTVHPGSSVPLALRAFNFLPSPFRPQPVSIVFTGISRISPSPSSSSSNLAAVEIAGSAHCLFRLEAQVVLDGPLWTGRITVPSSCRCETCGAVLEVVPWTFVHEDGESGTRFETVFQVEAKAGELRAGLKVEVLPRPHLPAGGLWQPVAGAGNQVVVQGGIAGLTVDEAKLSYRLATTSSPHEATADCPVQLEAVLRFRRSSSFSGTDLAALLSLLSPSSTTFTLEAVLSSLNGSASRPIGGSWTTSPDPNDCRLEVDSREEQLSVTIWLPLVPKAVVFASVASCAGFAVGFHLHLDIGPSLQSSDSSFGSLRISTPFLPPPATSASPSHVPPSTPPIPSPFAPTSAVGPSELEVQLRGMDDEEKGNVRKGRWRKRFKRFGRTLKMGLLQF